MLTLKKNPFYILSGNLWRSCSQRSLWLIGKPILVGRDGLKGMLLSVSQRNMSLNPYVGFKVIAPVG